MKNRMKARKMKRYHKEVYFPPWAEKSLQSFVDSVRTHGSITFSLHAVEKTVEYTVEYGRRFSKFLAKIIRQDVLKTGTVFEFYATEEEIRKVCYRVSSPSSPVDVAIVVSADGVIVTDFVINKDDTHHTLDENLYERKP